MSGLIVPPDEAICVWRRWSGGFGLGIDVGCDAMRGRVIWRGDPVSTDSFDVLQVAPAARCYLDLVGVDPYVGGSARHWSFLDTDDPFTGRAYVAVLF